MWGPPELLCNANLKLKRLGFQNSGYPGGVHHVERRGGTSWRVDARMSSEEHKIRYALDHDDPGSAVTQ